MKRYLSCLLALWAALLLGSCTAQKSPEQPAPGPGTQAVVPVTPAPPEAEPAPFAFTRENLPRLDGSTSTAPLAQAMCALLLEEDLDAVADLIQFSRTTQSYRNLMAGEADLLLAAEPASEVLSELESGGQWLLTPFATDALVFVVNEDNPVGDLTTEQVQKIYTGEITNWSEVGGDDLDIVPFQRNAEAGSQTMFEKLVMAGLPLMEAPKQWTSDSMSGLLEAVREYDNSPCAIGYTVYYYANDMEMAKGLKVLSIDGVTPSAQAIRAGEYPFLNPYFVAIAKDAPEESSTRALYDWVLGSEGQKLAAAEGYVPVLDVTAEQSPSDLYPDVDGGRWYPYTVTELIPGEDYGPLYPYVGASVTDVQYWTDDEGVEHSWVSPWPSAVYGLMTRDGKIVTDPAYQSVSDLIYRSGTQVIAHPVLLLGKADPAWNDPEITNSGRYAVAALDGSWCTDFAYWRYTANEDELLLMGPDGVTKMDPRTGAHTLWTWADLGMDEVALNSALDEVFWLYGFQWLPDGVFLGFTEPDNWEGTDVRLFDPNTGSVTIISRDEWEDILDAHFDNNRNTELGWDYVRNLDDITVTVGTKTYTLPVPEGLNILGNLEVAGDLAILWDYSTVHGTCWLYRLSTGELLLEGSYISFLSDASDPSAPAYIRVEDLNQSAFLYTPDFVPFLSYDGSGVYFSYQDGLITARKDGEFFAAYHADTQNCILYRNLFSGD